MAEQPQHEQWYDAVFADPALPPERKVRLLHECAADYYCRLQLIGGLVAGTITPQEVEEFVDGRREFVRQEQREFPERRWS